ncbi:unnamed protein product [Ascophyllum nodosum]
MGPLVATSISLYRLRALEPLLGSKKFGAFVAMSSILALPFEATAGVYFNTVRLTPGPLPLVFALLVVYYAIVPPSKPKFYGVMGMDFSDKTFTFCLAGMLACCEGWASFVPAACGALVGGLYVADALSIQAVRLPGVVYRCFSRLYRPFAVPPRRGRPFPGGASSGPRAPRRSRSTQSVASPRTAREGGTGRRGLFSFFTRRQGSGSARLRASTPSQPRPPPPPPPPSDEAVAALTAMGFERSAVLQALVLTGNDSLAAANVLISRAASGGGGGGGSEGGLGNNGGAGSSGNGGGGGSSAFAPPHDHAS